MNPQERADAATAIAAHALATPVIAQARRVACYLSMVSEPGTGPLLDALTRASIEVIVPISLDDHTLDWVRHDPGAPVQRTSLGIPEPAGDRLGPKALLGCDVVIVPALAVDHHGRRLGRGAGYYDRALSAVSVPICAIVFTHELLPDVPHEVHDVPVQFALTPSGLFRTQPAGG